MKHALKLAAADGLSLPVLFAGAASAAPAEANAVVTPAEDSPVMVLIGQLVISGNEASGNADSNQ
jgi:hypothetical protein